MNKLLGISFALAILLTYACKKEDNKIINNQNTPNPITYKKIGETWIEGAHAKAIVYAEKELFFGYNRLYVKIVDSVDGSELSNGEFSILPLMEMGSMVHSAPVENPTTQLAQNGYYNSNIAFIMSGTWALNIRYNNPKDQTKGLGKLSVDVMPLNPPRIKSVVGLDSNNVFISFLEPIKPMVGINDFEIAVHSMVNSNDFAAVTDYSIEIEPEMPSMGHGSPNNINPLHTDNGHYKGKVNFTMTGLWRINVTLKKNGTVINDELFFDITL